MSPAPLPAKPPLFASLESSPRLAALDAQGTGGGLLLSPERVSALLAAAARLTPDLDAATREATVQAHLAPFALGTGWRILYDCQRDGLLTALTSRPTDVATGLKRGRRAA